MEEAFLINQDGVCIARYTSPGSYLPEWYEVNEYIDVLTPEGAIEMAISLLEYPPD